MRHVTSFLKYRVTALLSVAATNVVQLLDGVHDLSVESLSQGVTNLSRINIIFTQSVQKYSKTSANNH